jgi:hypothetical protein
MLSLEVVCPGGSLSVAFSCNIIVICQSESVLADNSCNSGNVKKTAAVAALSPLL